MDDEDLLTDNIFNYVIGAVVVFGMFLVVVVLALYKFYLDHQHNQAKEQAHWDLMEEYQYSKSGLTAKLRHEVIATRTDSETQRVIQEESEQALRQRHKKEMKEQEKKLHHSHKVMLEAKMLEFEKQRHEDLKEKQNIQGHIRQLEEEVSSLKRRVEYSDSELEKQNQKLLDEVEAYGELRAKYDCDLQQRDDNIADLEEENKQLQHMLQARDKENANLQVEVESLKKKPEHGPLSKVAVMPKKAIQSAYNQMAFWKPKDEHNPRAVSETCTDTPYPHEPDKEPVIKYDCEDGNPSGQESTV